MSSSINPQSAQALTTRLHCTINGHAENVAWTYTIDEPHAVKIAVPCPVDDVTIIWEFARNLLADLTRPAGLGDVTLEPATEHNTVLRLESPDGKAELRFATDDIRQFRNRTYALCPPGQEPEPDLASIENVLRAAAEHIGGDW